MKPALRGPWSLLKSSRYCKNSKFLLSDDYVSIEIFWKQRIQATKNALKEADNWTTLTNEIEDCLDNGDLALISKKLHGIQGSLKILSHVPDYEDRVILVEGIYFF